MGSEGYFLNQFLVTHTNKRTDRWGGAYENRMRLPVEVVARVREAVGPDFILIYRLSMIDLIPEGSTQAEVVQLARAVEAAGASILNTGIGWHEARVPTIVTSVPRAGWAWVTQKLMGEVGIPVITSNRINTPEVAEGLLAAGVADMVSMARPFLADADFVQKAAEGRAETIAPCIACNQACLDHTFSGKLTSCLVNPRACHETELEITPADTPKRIAVVGAGPAGLSAAITAAGRGHRVTLFDKAGEIGGQLNMARVIPGKEEFHGLVDWYDDHAARDRGDGHARRGGGRGGSRGFRRGDRRHRRAPPRSRHRRAGRTQRAELHRRAARGRAVGRRVAIVGAGGIGFDVAEFLVHEGESPTEDLALWRREWGVGDPAEARGGLAPEGPAPAPPARQVTLLQRKAERVGKRLGKTTGWIHRAELRMKGVEMLPGAHYERIDAEGLHVRFGETGEDARVIACDTVVLCAGQVSERSLADALAAQGITPHVIGGADVAAELDAKRAIDQGTRLAASL